MLINSRTFLAAALIALAAVGLSGCSLDELHHELMTHNADPVSGEWDATFKLDEYTAPFVLKLKLNGGTVTGTGESEHTGPGTVRDGKWTKNTFSCTLDFANHESIALTGKLQDGLFTGEFRTEGRQGTWQARKK